MPELGGDVRRAAQAISKVAGAAGNLLQKGMGAVKKAVGQTEPTDQEVYNFLHQKQIPQAHAIAVNLIKLGVKPHTKKTASELDYDEHANRIRWDQLLRKAGVDSRMDRFNLLNPLVKADIAAWMPLIREQSVS